jgi:N-sulfoglucosamine sulfohydrolase
MRYCLLMGVAVVVAIQSFSAASASDRPNILWITSEDNSCYLGCYGDDQAHTPHLDQLAAEGVRYRHAFANAPVCSTARTTLITGMHASSLGVHHHRSRVAIPERFKLYPQHLRDAGYYCTNSAKEDYNLAGRSEVWDASDRTAHYRDRQPGQPFFAVFNLGSTHESQVAAPDDKTAFRIAPENFRLPPYHPDTEVIRRDWANYYEQMTKMDAQAGKLLEELQASGLADDTIVIYCSDHGGALPGGKRSIRDVGTRVPLIIRFPQKWAHLAPAAPGSWVDSPISFVDLPATFLSLCGIAVPDHFEGVPFLGEQQAEPQPFVFLFRGRMDERYDTVRAIRSRSHRYVKNYSPHRPAGQHYTYAFQVQPSMRSWYAEFEAGRTNDVRSAYWLPRASEELYDLTEDSDELNNLAAVADARFTLNAMREQLRQRMVELRDPGLIPEGMVEQLIGEQTVYEYAQSGAYPIERVIEIADLATSRNATALQAVLVATNDSHPVIRYWAATGCLILKAQAAGAKSQLRKLLADDFDDVRVVAAEAIAHQGETDAALKTLKQVLLEGNAYEALAAQNAIEYLWRDGVISLEQAQATLNVDRTWSEPNNRIPNLLKRQAAQPGVPAKG